VPRRKKTSLRQKSKHGFPSRNQFTAWVSYPFVERTASPRTLLWTLLVFGMKIIQGGRVHTFGGKLLPHSDLRGEVFLGKTSRSIQREIKIGTWNVRRRPLGRPRCRWVDNIRMDLQEVGCGYMDWIGLAQDRDRWRKLVGAGMNFRVP